MRNGQRFRDRADPQGNRRWPYINVPRSLAGRDWLTCLRRPKQGDEVHLKAGTYHGTAPLPLPAGVRLIGTECVTLQQDGEGPILTVTGSDCQLSKISFSSTREGQICVQITYAERVLVSEYLYDGGGVARASIFIEQSQQITIQSCTATGFSNDIVLVSSHGEVVGNRCHDNTQAGIVFSRSTGRVEADKCWGNLLNAISADNGSEVVVQDHRTSPSRSLEELRSSRLLLHPLGAWFTKPEIINHPSAEGVADFLHSGGCPDCFSHFWTCDTQATPTSPPTSTPTTIPSDDRIRTYEVRPSQNQAVTIHRTTVPPGRATAPRNGLERLTSLLSRFSDLVKTRTPKDLPLRWAVGSSPPNRLMRRRFMVG